MIFPGVPCTILYEYKHATCLNNTALDIDEPNRPGKQADAVPPGEVWFWLSGHLYNGDSVTRACTMQVRDQLNRQVVGFWTGNIAAGGYGFAPCTTASLIMWNGGGAVPLFPGEKLRFYWGAGGASAGGVCYYGYRIIVYKISDLNEHGITVEAGGYSAT